jgi:imidazolonepropionase-like amidohydrolase
MNVSHRLSCVALLAGTLASPALAQQHRTYIVRNVHVIPMTGAAVTRSADVVIRGRTIAQILPAGTARAASDAIVIDGRGQYLIPGLIDSHVHIKEQDPLFLYVAAGVTTVQNMSGRPFHLDMRARVNAGTLLGPRIVTTGPTTAEVGVTTAEAVERLVAEQKARGYDAIKMYGSQGGNMTPEAYRALIAAARGHGLRVVGHAPRNLAFDVVLGERQHSIDHMEEIVYTHRPFARLLGPYVDLQFGRASDSARDSLARVPVPDFAAELGAEIAELARAVRQAGLAVTPNLVFFRNIHWMTTDSIHALLRAPELAYAAPQQRLNWSPLLNRYHNSWRGRRETISRYLGAVVDLQRAITLAFHRAGVPLMTGTDAEFLGAQPGFGVHTELELFVDIGMTPMEALRAATVTPAGVMQIADSVGTIAPGKVADLVLLAANPLTDIRNTRRISGVFRSGRWLPQPQIAAALDSLAGSYGPVQTALSEFVQALETRGAAAAMDVYRQSPQRQQIAQPVENVINSYGYRVLGERRTKDAIAIFLLNTEAFPGEYNTWDSLAEAYLADGQRELAIRYYRKVLEMRPGDENATRMLRQMGVSVN